MKILSLHKKLSLNKLSNSNGRSTRILIDASKSDIATILKKLKTSVNGITQEEAEVRMEKYGPNITAQEKHTGRVRLFLILGKALVNPLVVLLTVLAAISFITGDMRAGIVMSAMVVLGVVLRFFQEAKADLAAVKLKAMISVTATVIREGKTIEMPLHQLVPGDIVKLAAGDMIPADVRLISSKDLFIIQASMTGESFPIEKYDTIETEPSQNPLELKNICLLGTSIERGTATAVVLTTGARTYLGKLSNSLIAQRNVKTSFDKGVSRFTWLIIRFMMVMVPLIFAVNYLTKHDLKQAFFFALAVAVGMTPEMLPMIITVCLSKGAISMSKKKVIVKRLNSIQNFGAMDILCTDKTGTLTLDKVVLEYHCDVTGKEDEKVLSLAYLNSYFQTGLKNVLDRAILDHKEVHEQLDIERYRKVDEIPFDFSRRLMSVVVEELNGDRQLICKGAAEEIFKRCGKFELAGKLHPMEELEIGDLRKEYENLNNDGFRVLAIAYKKTANKHTFNIEDETDLIMRGYVAFLDPPKESAKPALVDLQKNGVTVKILTGDNMLVSKKICKEVGIKTENVLIGAQIETMSDEELSKAVDKTTLFARLAPSHKARIIKALQKKGHAVGFLGDGINDALALKAADVGISVDTAVDIAKESADLILLEKNLMILNDGVLDGRKVYANILKYIRMGASSSFGNMFSVIGASAFLPFLPMAPMQILTNNLLYDISQVPIPTDNVDKEQIAKPRPWVMNEISRFILFIGPCSSIFDYSTYLIMLFIFNCWDVSMAPLFQTGWFVESLLTQTLIVHIIRTNKTPFLQSRGSLPLLLTTLLVMTIGILLPLSPIGASLGFTKLPLLYWPLLLAMLICYIFITQKVKMFLLRKAWI